MADAVVSYCRNITYNRIVKYVHIMPESFTDMQITAVYNMAYIISVFALHYCTLCILTQLNRRCEQRMFVTLLSLLLLLTGRHGKILTKTPISTTTLVSILAIFGSTFF